MKKIYLTSTTIVASLLLSACSSDNDFYGTDQKVISEPMASFTKEELGKKLFFDANLSLTRNTSCATCHDPEHGFIDARFSESNQNQNIFINGAFSVGDDGSSLGARNTPTASYAQFNPVFGKNSDGDYIGGQFHDGRAVDLTDQAARPPLDIAEMMMPDKNSVVNRIKENSEYVNAFEDLFGVSIFDDINASFTAMAESIATFEKTEEFAPFDSKYDRWKKGTYTFTTEEEGGYVLFFSQANTSCVTCHSINSQSEASSNELFTNFKYENIGTPRNISAMDARFALGLQESNAVFKGLGSTVEATDINYTTHLGKTKVPTLRNIAITAPYMNNGVFTKLRTVLEFYDHIGEDNANLHPLNPETNQAWGINDHQATINHTDLLQKSMNDAKIRNLEAFLRTLTDAKYEHLLPVLAPEGELGN